MLPPVVFQKGAHEASRGTKGLLLWPCFCMQRCLIPTVHALLQVMHSALLGCPQSHPARPGLTHILQRGRNMRCCGLCSGRLAPPLLVYFCLRRYAACFKRAPAVLGYGGRGDVPEAGGLPQLVCLVLEDWGVDRAHDLRVVVSVSGHIQHASLHKAVAHSLACTYRRCPCQFNNRLSRRQTNRHSVLSLPTGKCLRFITRVPGSRLWPSGALPLCAVLSSCSTLVRRAGSPCGRSWVTPADDDALPGPRQPAWGLGHTTRVSSFRRWPCRAEPSCAVLLT